MKQWVGNAVRGKLAPPKKSCVEKNVGKMVKLQKFGSFAVKTKKSGLKTPREATSEGFKWGNKLIFTISRAERHL